MNNLDSPSSICRLLKAVAASIADQDINLGLVEVHDGGGCHRGSIQTPQKFQNNLFFKRLVVPRTNVRVLLTAAESNKNNVRMCCICKCADPRYYSTIKQRSARRTILKSNLKENPLVLRLRSKRLPRSLTRSNLEWKTTIRVTSMAFQANPRPTVAIATSSSLRKAKKLPNS